MSLPEDLQYTEHDEWVALDGDILTLGITDHAQDALGELVHIELPKVGRRVRAGDAIAEVESVKAVAEVYTPVSGEIVAINDGLDGNEGVINADPYGSGWLVKIQVSDAGPLANLLDAHDYKRKLSK